MKNINLILSLLMMGIFLAFPSCDDDDDVTTTQTDASGLVVGTYSGTLSYASTSDTTTYSDAMVTLTQIESDSLEADSINIQVPSFSDLNVSAALNVATANDDYLLSSGMSTWQKMDGRVSADTLSLNVPLNKKGTKLSNSTLGKVWTFTGIKEE